MKLFDLTNSSRSKRPQQEQHCEAPAEEEPQTVPSPSAESTDKAVASDIQKPASASVSASDNAREDVVGALRVFFFVPKPLKQLRSVVIKSTVFTRHALYLLRKELLRLSDEGGLVIRQNVEAEGDR